MICGSRRRSRSVRSIWTTTKRIRKSSTGFISLYLRLKGLKGDYFWNFIIAFLTENGEILLLIRDTDDSWKPTKKDIFSQKESSTTTEPAREKIDDEVLWKSLMNGIGVGIFWKDRQRRFCGANQMFLDYYGLHSVEEILGKTDEDMGWHVNPDPYRDDELAVIQEGKVTRDVPGRCLVHGVNRDIMASKMPLYKAGKIVGLVGQFRDVTDTKDTAFVAARETTDEITGLLNYNGFKEVKMRYIDEWNFHGVQFQAMAVGIDNFMELRKLYGDEFSLRVMRAAAERLKEVCGTKCAIARFSGSEFAILLQTEEPEKMNHLAEEIERSIAHIHVLNGTACSLYLSIGIADSTMTEPENVQKAAFEKMKQKQKEHTEKFS